jgi:outer membrane lipoprotein SlyB
MYSAPRVSGQEEAIMPVARVAPLLIVATLLSTGCVGVQSTTRTWSEPQAAEPVWHGQVIQVSETVEELRGDPAAGAVAGAVVGGVLGSALSHGHGGGLFGALAGAMIGADASRVQQTRWFHDVVVRFDDGSLRTYRYEGQAPFRVGDPVVLSSRGLARS